MRRRQFQLALSGTLVLLASISAASLSFAKDTPTNKLSHQVTVRVIDPDGEPVHSAKVWLGREQGAGGMERPIVDGVATFMKPSVPFMVRVQRATDSNGVALPLAPQVRKALGKDNSELVFTLEPGRRLRGVTRGPGGKPVGGVEIHAKPVLHGPGFEHGPRGVDQIVTSDVDGSFEFSALDQIDYTLRAIPPAPFAQPKIVRVPHDALSSVVVVQPGTAIRIEDYKGSAVPGARIMIAMRPTNQVEAVIYEGTANKQGNIYVRHVPTTQVHHLIVYAPKDRIELFGLQRYDWTSNDTTIILDRGYPMRGTVNDRGQPVQGARVIVDGWSGPVPTPQTFPSRIMTDREGRFEIPCLPKMPMKITVYDAEPGQGKSEPIKATPGGGDVTVSLRRPDSSLSINVGDFETEAWGYIEGADVSGKLFGMSSGTHTFDSLFEGHYSIFVRDPNNDHRCAFGTTEVKGDSTLKLAFIDCPPIQFRVVLPEGIEATARVSGPAGYSRSMIIDDDNLMTGFPAGNWPITVQGHGNGHTWKGKGVSTTDGTVPTIKLTKVVRTNR